MSVQTSLPESSRRGTTPGISVWQSFHRVYVWAHTRRIAEEGARLPANRFPRYRSIADAYAAQDAGDDGCPGELLYPVRLPFEGLEPCS